MNKNTTKIFGLIAASVLVSACDTDFSNPVGDTSSYSAGDADFSKYVAIGDSLTAGYADGALYRSGQENSYPNILAGQLATVGGGAFTQPLMNDNLGGLLAAGNPIPDFDNRLVLDGATSTPEPIAGTPTNDVAASGLTGSFNNMGVPGAKSFHLGAPGYGNIAGLSAGAANPYYIRFASSTTSTVIGDAAVQQPSFFTLWIGNNDTLSFATSGGVGVDQTGNLDPATYGRNDITDPNVFASTYNSLITAITTANPNAKGVLINLPDVTSIPFFTTVPHNPVVFTDSTEDQGKIALLNNAFAAYNVGLDGAVALTAITQAEADRRKISFATGQNAVVIEDESLTNLTGSGLPSYRHATADDLLLLTTRSKIGEMVDGGAATDIWGLSVPLTDADVLIPSEITAIETANAAYNATIEGLANASATDNLILFDARASLADLKANGVDYGTGFISSAYATGGAFSLDGVHPTQRGYAHTTNELIDAINAGFNANIPRVDPGAYPTIFLK